MGVGHVRSCDHPGAWCSCSLFLFLGISCFCARSCLFRLSPCPLGFFRLSACVLFRRCTPLARLPLGLRFLFFSAFSICLRLKLALPSRGVLAIRKLFRLGRTGEPNVTSTPNHPRCGCRVRLRVGAVWALGRRMLALSRVVLAPLLFPFLGRALCCFWLSSPYTWLTGFSLLIFLCYSAPIDHPVPISFACCPFSLLRSPGFHGSSLFLPSLTLGASP